MQMSLDKTGCDRRIQQMSRIYPAYGILPSCFYGKHTLYQYGTGFFRRKKQEMQKAHTFLNISGLIGYVYTFNNNEFENYYKDICPDELELKKVNEDSCQASFCIFQQEPMIGSLPLSCLLKEMPFPYNLSGKISSGKSQEILFK